MRTVFFGTPSWAVPSLRSLDASDVEVAAVVTNPDRKAGRGMKLQASPVKVAAEDLGIEVIQEPARSPELLERLRSLAPDVAVVVAYGSILPISLLEVPPSGFVNLHFSLLPRYRGAAPVQRAIMNSDAVSGVSIMVLTEGMDEGPVITSEEIAIEPSDTSGTYGAKLADIGAQMLVEVLGPYVDGSIQPVGQDDSLATYAPKLTTEDGRIDWHLPARKVIDLVRALTPDPGAWTTLRGARLKVLSAADAPVTGLAPGAISTVSGLIVGTGDGAVSLEEVQPATKKAMSGADLARGLRSIDDERMGE